MRNVTIVMYHYVRDLSNSRYPKIKGLELKNFIKQLDYLDHNFSFVRMEDCLEAIYNDNVKFPENAVLLTFDDGYAEHFTEVFPILDDRGIQGSFFPPVQSTLEEKVLDVNKIHFILAAVHDPKKLLAVLASQILDYKNEFNLSDARDYFGRIESLEHPYDPIEVIIFKRVLQRELPFEARQLILSDLFDEYVGVAEDVFSNELYMKETQLKTMKRHGMFVGGHGYSHKWLNAMEEDEQKYELEKTEGFLQFLGVENEHKVICYPYGGYDSSLIRQISGTSFVAGLATTPEKAVLDDRHRFRLGRVDTNEIGGF